jgi:phosphoribosylamine--glycine ligase
MVDGKHVLPLGVESGSQAAARRRSRARTRAAWAPIRPRLSSRRNCTPASCAKSFCRRCSGMEQEGIRYTGFLYAGLMIDAHGNPKTLEFNCRMGDPGNPADHGAPEGRFLEGGGTRDCRDAGDTVEIEWDRRTALGVVLAAHNYPDTPRKGDRISGIPAGDAGSRDFPCRHHAGKWQAQHVGRTCAVRRGFVGLGTWRAVCRLRYDQSNHVRRHAVSARHWLSRTEP